MEIFNFAIDLKKLVYLIPIAMLLQGSVQAQLLDDSTQLVYSAETTFFTDFESIKRSKERYTNVDSMLDRTHIWEPVERSGYYLQDLGTIGTALRPVFYELPDYVGRNSGYGVYDYYYNKPKDIRFFDTKSPFTELNAVFGGNNRAIIETSFSRNINERWNMGFNFKRYTVDKQIGRELSRGDIQALTTSYDIFTDYTSEDGKYRVLGSFSRLGNVVNETGGIVPDTSGFYFDYEDATIRFSDAFSNQIRQHYFVYQEYALNDQLTFYYQTDRVNEINRFIIPTNPVKDTAALGIPVIRTDSTTERANYGYWQNEIGVKGKVKDLHYAAFVKRRDGTYMVRFLNEAGHQTDQLFGGYARYDFKDSLSFIRAEAELMLDGNFKFSGAFNSPWLTATFTQSRYETPFLHNLYFGNYAEWFNNFDPVDATRLDAKLKIEVANFSIYPKLSFSAVNRHYYFNSNRRPEQAVGIATILSPGVEWKSVFANVIHFEGDVIYTNIGGESANAFRIPEWFGTLRLYWQKNLFNSALLLRTGIDAHAKSGYFVQAYDPVTMQFYLQNDFFAPAYFFVDPYVSFRVGSAKVFVKMRHVNEGLGTDGYFPTAEYSGTRRVFDLGVNWMFFN